MKFRASRNLYHLEVLQDLVKILRMKIYNLIEALGCLVITKNYKETEINNFDFNLIIPLKKKIEKFKLAYKLINPQHSALLLLPLPSKE